MPLLFFLAWVIFNGKVTLEIVLFGILISAVLFLFACCFMDYSLEKEKVLLRKVPRIGKTLAVLLVEIIKANLAVARKIYDPKEEIHPAIIHFQAPLKSDYARVVLADCITMTPGTITGELKGNHYTVHCLDKNMGDGIDDSSFVHVLRELEADDQNGE